jgi:hypothetical protein
MERSFEMESQIRNNSVIEDLALNDALDEHGRGELDGLSMEQQREARILEYEEVAVEQSDPFEAITGMQNASLARIFERLSAAVVKELNSKNHSLQDIREYTTEIKSLVQIQRNIELDRSLNLALAGCTGPLPQRRRIGTSVSSVNRPNMATARRL